MWFVRKRPSYEEAFKDCKTPRDVCAVVRQWVEPLPTLCNERDTDSTRTWYEGFGDCDDIAYLVHEACKRLDSSRLWAVSTVTFFWPLNKVREGHALCHGIWNNVRWVSDNGEYLEDSEPEAVAAKRLNCSRVWSRRMT